MLGSRRHFLNGLGVVAAVIILLAACAPAATSQPTISGSVKVGILSDLTGNLSFPGKFLTNNIQLATDQVNAGGGTKLELIIEDTASDPAVAVEKATKLVQRDQVAAVIGVITSAAREAVRPIVADRAKTIFIYVTGYEGGDCNPNLFSTGYVPPQQVEPYVPWLMQEFGKKFFLFGADYVWPQSMFKQTRALVEKSGGSVVGEDYVPLSATEFTTLVSHVRAAQPNVLISAFPVPAWTTTLQQLNDAGLLKGLGVGTYFMSDGQAEGIPIELRNGLTTANAYFYDVPGENNRKYLEAYRAKFGPNEQSDAIGMGAFNAVHLYHRAITAAKTTATDAVRAALVQATFPESPAGPVAFGPDHHVTENMYIARVKDGKFKIEKSFEKVPSAQACKF